MLSSAQLQWHWFGAVRSEVTGGIALLEITNEAGSCKDCRHKRTEIHAGILIRKSPNGDPSKRLLSSEEFGSYIRECGRVDTRKKKEDKSAQKIQKKQRRRR